MAIRRFGFFALACTMAVTGCGSPLDQEEAPEAPIDPTAPARVDLFLSSPELPSAGNTAAEGVTVTALVRDANNAAIAGAQVIFAVDNDAALTVAVVETGDDGTAQTVVTTGNDPTNRTINVSATAGDITQSTTLAVRGTTISITGPTSTQFQTDTAYTVTLLDSTGTGIANTDVLVSSTAAGFPTATSTTVRTDAAGQAQVTFRPTTNATSATLTAQALEITDTQAVTISTDSFVISTPTANQELPLGTGHTVSVTWRRGTQAVSGASVTFSATRGGFTTATTTTTNASGVATATISSNQAGPVTITANGRQTAGSGTPAVTTTVTVAATRTAEFIATTPDALALQPDPTTVTVGQLSTLTAIVRDAANNFVKGQVVNFRIASGPGSVSPSSATTDSNGVAVATFTATATSSGQGVQVVAELANNVSIGDTASIVVGGSALRLVLGTGNQMQEFSTTAYKLPYSVIVTDSNGTAVPNKTVNLSLHAMTYSKGCSVFDGAWVRTDCEPVDPGLPIDCPNEDLLSTVAAERLNGILDGPHEDRDGDGALDPEHVGSVPSSVVTDENGIADFDVLYLQDRAYWVRVRLRATTAVGGTEAVTQTFFDLPGTADDFNDEGVAPPGPLSPYGVIQACDEPD